MIDPSTPIGQRITPHQNTQTPHRSHTTRSRAIAQSIPRRSNADRSTPSQNIRHQGRRYSIEPVRNRPVRRFSGGDRSTQPVTNRPIARAPKPPSFASWLNMDNVYQNILRTGNRSLHDFLGDLQRRRSEATTSYNQTAQSMEQDRVKQLSDLRDEFASRGLINSGLYGKEQGDFQNQYAQQKRTLDQQQTSLLADLLNQDRNYRREQQSAYENARQEALQRRAAQYKIGI